MKMGLFAVDANRYISAISLSAEEEVWLYCCNGTDHCIVNTDETSVAKYNSTLPHSLQKDIPNKITG